MKQLLLTLVLLLFFPTMSALAVKLPSLYEVELPVETQLEDARAEAVKQAFIQVLMKVSGDPTIEKNADIMEGVKKSGYYVQEFSYRTADASTTPYFINIRFNPVDINRLLKRAGISYWGEERPLILVWLAVTDNKHNIEIIGNETPGDLLENMEQQGKKYGLPLIFPMMDVTDVSQVSTDDIIGGALPVIKEASKRYKPDALLVGSIEQTGDGYESEWQLILGEDVWSWTITDRAVDKIIAAILNQGSQKLARYYIVKNANSQPLWLTIEVTNVTERTDLADLLRYLKQLPPVQQIQLKQVSGNVVELAVLIHGPLAAFQQNAAINQRLIFKSQDDAKNKLIYDWVH